MLLRDHSVRKLIHTSPPWDVLQASPSVSIRHFEIMMPPLNPKLRLVFLQIRSLFPNTAPFRPFLILFDPNTPLLVPKLFILGSNSTQLNTNDAIRRPVVPSSSRMSGNRYRALLHTPNSSPIKRNLSQPHANIFQFVPTHRGLFRCASTHLKDVNICPATVLIVRKCAELIVDRTFTLFNHHQVNFNSIQWLRLSATTSKCVPLPLICSEIVFSLFSRIV